MKELQLIILEKSDLENRYIQVKNSRMAHLTDKAVAEGYSIAILHYPGLKRDTASEWLSYAENAVAARFKGHRYQIGVFTDLSEVEIDKLYFSFKTKKDVSLGHIPSGCDSDGFKYDY